MVAMLTDSISIAEGQVVVLPQQTHQIIYAISGVLWITQGGNAHDMLLHAGERLALANGGMIAIQSLQAASTFRITRALAGRSVTRHQSTTVMPMVSPPAP